MAQKILTWYEKLEEILASVAMIIGVGIMFVGVVARYVFRSPISFVDEIAPIFFVWSTMIGYSIAQRKDEHIKMDALYEAIKLPAIRKGMLIFEHICGCLFCAFMIRYGWSSMMMQYDMGRVTPILEFPVWVTYLVIPVIGVVLAIRFVAQLWNLLKPPPKTGEVR